MQRILSLVQGLCCSLHPIYATTRVFRSVTFLTLAENTETRYEVRPISPYALYYRITSQHIADYCLNCLVRCSHHPCPGLTLRTVMVLMTSTYLSLYIEAISAGHTLRKESLKSFSGIYCGGILSGKGSREGLFHYFAQRWLIVIGMGYIFDEFDDLRCAARGVSYATAKDARC